MADPHTPLTDLELSGLLSHTRDLVVRDGRPGVSFGVSVERDRDLQEQFVRAVHDLAARRGLIDPADR